MEPKKILLVCLGNICRSPMAEGVLRAKAMQRRLPVITDSAGTSGFHTGESPDIRAQKAMRSHGIDISDLRARELGEEDFHRFDLLLVMDQENLDNVLVLAPDAVLAQKVKLMMDYAPEHPEREVPDSYFGGDEGFHHVHGMLDKACDKLLDELFPNG